MDCLTPADQAGDFRCEWMPTPENYDCAIDWPSTTPAPEGCCKGDAPRTNVRCNGYDSEDRCLRMAACQWVVTEEMTEIEAEQACEYVTTTSTPPAPGCCMLDDTRPMSYEMGWDGQCITFSTEDQCVRPYSQDGHVRCRWVETDDDQDCSLFWPTSTPTVAPAPGCCAALNKHVVDRCEAEAEMDRCDRMASCHWIITDDSSDCEWTSTTAPPPEPGCCTVSDTNDNSGHWNNICRDFYTEAPCMQPQDDNGDDRCSWTETEDTYDCR